MYRISIFFSFFCFFLSSCSITEVNDGSPVNSLDGIWETEGYGYVLEIKNGRARLFDQTDISCLPSVFQTGKVYAKNSGERSARFSISIPGFLLTEMKLWKSVDDSYIVLHRQDTLTHIRAKELKRLPSICDPETLYDTASVAEVFAKIFLENYPFFTQRGFDKGRLQNIGDLKHLNDEELFQFLSAEIRPLNDQHTLIFAPDDDFEFWGGGSVIESEFDEDNRKHHLETIISDHSLGRPQVYANDSIIFMESNGGIGYLKIDTFYQFDGTISFARDEKVLRKTLSALEQQINNTDKLIIDLRYNQGGYDSLALDMMEAISNNDYLAFTKQAYTNTSSLEFTPPQEIRINSMHRSECDRYIAVLTSQNTASAAEVFSLMLRQYTPRPVFIGEPTRGAFSDILPKTLPNGWIVGLSNEIYRSDDAVSFEVSGIAPDQYFPFDVEMQLSGSDPALTYAFKHLKSKKKCIKEQSS